MSQKTSKRVWEKVTFAESENGFCVFLDNRHLRTPGKALLELPTQSLAQLVAFEWDSQSDKIDPGSMPHTRTANSAIDKVALQRAEIAEMLAAYGDSDLLCYRAESPAKLVKRQSDAWDPYLDWAAQTFNARLSIRTGVIHIPQSDNSLSQLRTQVLDLTIFELAAFHDLVSLTGSLILGLASTRNFRAASEIWLASRVDEIWQTEQWGDDEVAQNAETIKQKSFFDAESFFHSVQKNR